MELKDTAPAQGGIQMVHGNSIKISTPRQRRLVEALYQGPRSREELDRIVGCSNSPETVRQLRENGLAVPCQRVPHVDRDGVKGRHGVYNLTESDRLRLRGRFNERGGVC